MMAFAAGSILAAIWDWNARFSFPGKLRSGKEMRKPHGKASTCVLNGVERWRCPQANPCVLAHKHLRGLSAMRGSICVTNRAGVSSLRKDGIVDGIWCPRQDYVNR